VSLTGVCLVLLVEKVELAGIEPASKRGRCKLSTCLSLIWFSNNHRIKATNNYLISFISLKHQSVISTSLDLLAPLIQAASKQ
jgi:hypothetical protein